MSREVSGRIAAGMVAAWRDRVRHLAGHAIHEFDGVVVCLSNLPDDDQNVALIEREPADVRSSLAGALGMFEAHGRSPGFDLARGRHPDVEDALRGMGLDVVATRPAMAMPVDRIEALHVPDRVEIVRANDAEILEGLVDVEVASFGTDRTIAERLLSPAQLSFPSVRLYAAVADRRAVAQAYTHTVAGAVGIFGVATLPEFRRRGIGTAITAFAIDDVRERADLAWLQATESGRPLYEGMGFRQVADWDVWARGEHDDGS